MTHYDADHWRGLENFARQMATAACLRPAVDCLPIFSPAVPALMNPRVPAGAAALVSATSDDGVQAGDLVAAWAAILPAVIVPRREGDVIFVAGREHVALWPPARLSASDAAYADSVLRDIVELAEKSPRLKQALKDAYGSAMFDAGRGVDDASQGEHSAADVPESEHPSLSAVVESEVSAMELAEQDAEPAVGSDLPNVEEDSPRVLLRANRQLVRRARALQNYLSLVFYDRERSSLVCYGDAPRAVVEHVNTKIRGQFEVILAPHHGTQPVPSNMPMTDTCVAQGGARTYRDNWQRLHVPTHGSDASCTHLAGVAGGVLELPVS